MSYFSRPPLPAGRRTRPFLAAAVGLVGATLLAACSSNGSTNSGSGSGSGGGTTTSSTAATTDASVYTIDTRNISGVGTVLVNGKGRTLYVLSNEAGGKIVCVASTGCTSVWPPAELASGVASPVAGNGVDTTKLTAEHTSDGHVYGAYAGYALYTYSGDTGPNSTNGIGIQSFGGTWYAISPSGSLVMAASSGGGSY